MKAQVGNQFYIGNDGECSETQMENHNMELDQDLIDILNRTGRRRNNSETWNFCDLRDWLQPQNLNASGNNSILTCLIDNLTNWLCWNDTSSETAINTDCNELA